MTIKEDRLNLRSNCVINLFYIKTHCITYLRELCSIASVLEPLATQNRVTGFITASDDAGLIKEYVQKVEQALTDYQVCSFARYMFMIS
jgi:hypothetical protein